MARILVTGGAGYIGSHTAHYLLQRGHDVQVLDDLSKGYENNVPPGRLARMSLHDRDGLARLFSSSEFDAVIHFAAFIAVGESMRNPEVYFHNNVGGTVSLLDAMATAGVRRLVFSSTAAVYGTPEEVPITEETPKNAVNPYGESKLMVERILHWLDRCSGLRFVALRYFNACGSIPEFGLGEEHEPETHLIPLILRAIRTGEPLHVFGDDYDTPDGTCIRDYVHVLDLASAHAAALTYLLEGGASEAFNCGTGQGFSVLEVIRSAERVTGRKVPFQISPRRAGDPPSLVAESSKLKKTLGWTPVFTSLDRILASAWEFECRRHPVT